MLDHQIATTNWANWPKPKESTPSKQAKFQVSRLNPIQQAPASAVGSCAIPPFMPICSIKRLCKQARYFPTMTPNTETVVYWASIDAVHQ